MGRRPCVRWLIGPSDAVENFPLPLMICITNALANSECPLQCVNASWCFYMNTMPFMLYPALLWCAPIPSLCTHVDAILKEKALTTSFISAFANNTLSPHHCQGEPYFNPGQLRRRWQKKLDAKRLPDHGAFNAGRSKMSQSVDG